MAEELTLEQIGTHLQIEEESRICESTNSVCKVNEGTVNYVQNGGVGSSKTHKSFKPNKKTFKKTNLNKDKKGRAYFHCRKKGHYIRECRFLKNQLKEKELNTSEANVVDEIVAMNHLYHRLLTHIVSHSLVINHIDNLLSYNYEHSFS